jgi:cytochrome c2
MKGKAQQGNTIVKKLIVAAALIVVSSVSGVAQDAQKGEAVFNICLACHAIGPGAQNKIGPELNGLDGRRAGTVPNFEYSDATRTRVSFGMKAHSRSTSKIRLPRCLARK